MKNKFFRLISLVLAVVMVSVLVAGCKKNTDTDNNSSDVKTTAETSSNTDSETKDESSATESVTDTQSTENEENVAKINAEIEKENQKHYYTIDHQIVTYTDGTPTFCVSDSEQSIFKYVNEERVKAGVKPLTWNEGIYPYVKQRSIEVTETHCHTRDKAHGYRNWDTVFTDAGIHPTGKIGENLLEVSGWWEPLDDFDKTVVQLWVESPEHYEAMIDPDYKSTAICIYSNARDGYLYITEIFWY